MDNELITLKDLEKRWNYIRNKKLTKKEEIALRELLYEHKLLRQTAIKWIEYLRGRIKEDQPLKIWIVVITEKMRWIQFFFNLTDEEIGGKIPKNWE